MNDAPKTKLSAWPKFFLVVLLLLPIVGGSVVVWLAATSAPGELHSRLGAEIGGALTALLVPIAVGVTLIHRKRKYGAFRQTEQERTEIRAKMSQQRPQPLVLRILTSLIWVLLATFSTFKGFHGQPADKSHWFIMAMCWCNAIIFTGLAFRKQPPGDLGAPIALNLGNK